MKKVTLSLGLLASVAGVANAQATYGIKAGVSGSDLVQNENAVLTNAIVGGHGGVFANFRISEKFSIQPEVLFSTKGNDQQILVYKDGSLYSLNQKLRFSYVDIPVMVKFSFQEDKGFFFEAGPQLSILLRAKSENSTLPAIPGYDGEKDIKGDLNTIDFGLSSGVGYQLKSGPVFGVRHSGGFIDVFKDNNSSGDSALNSAYQVYVGFRFKSK